MVKEKLCKRKPGVGFEYQGRRLIGITEHLRRNYYPHFQASRKGGTGSKFRGLGLRMGSVADSAVTVFAKTGNARKMAHCPAAARIVKFLSVLGLDIVDAHVLVCDPNIGVATEIDVLTEGPRGLVVVENKTTLQTRAEHERTYKKPDRECPLLLKGFLSLLNNEYNHHQLQLAFMVLMLKNTYNIDASGIVLVASSDGLNHYPINPTILTLARNVIGNQVFFGTVPSPSPYPTINYRYRAYLPKISPFDLGSDIGTRLAKLLKRFKAISEPVYNTNTGHVSFYERADVILPVSANIRLDNHLILVRKLPLGGSKLLTIPVSTVKLPSGHAHTPLTLAYLELAILTIATEAPITAHVIFLDDENVLKPVVRGLPKAFLKAVKG